MTYAFVSSVTIPGTQNGTTSAAIDTTGATILFAAVAYHGFGSSPVTSDFYSNTWTPCTAYVATIGAIVVYYVKNPTVGTGHNFTLTGTSTFASACIAAFSGADTSAPFDVENGNGVIFPNNVTSIQTGTLTPSQDNSLVLAALGTAPNGGPSGYTIDSGFTITDTVDALDNQASGSGLAYLIQTTATAKNPTWTIANPTTFGTTATIDSWKPAAAAPFTPVLAVRKTRFFRRTYIH